MAHDTAPVDLAGPIDDRGAATGRRRAIAAIAGAAVLAAALRLPYAFTGLSTDEGGYAYVAQQWARGARLYDTALTGSAWLDRPQGLLLAYRAMLWVNDSGWTIRAGMMLAGAVITACLGVIGWQLAGHRAGVAAAVIYAVVGVAPHLEGMTLNGELLASVPATASVAAIVLWWRRRRAGWLLLSGLLAGVALTMKQSGVDGLLVGLAAVLVTAGPWRRRVGRAAAFGAAFVLPVGACVLHGIALGWNRYWTALAGYQFSAMGGSGENADTRWHDFTTYLSGVAWDLAVVLVVAAFGFRPLHRFARTLLATWLVAGFIGVNLGGSYWPHYYMQPLPPLVLLAAVALTGYPMTGRARRALRASAAVLLLLPPLIWMAALVPMSPATRARTIPYDALAIRDDHIAAAIDAETTPDQRIYVLESEAYLYFLAQRQAGYPYLWGKPIQKIATAVPLLRTMLSGPDRPTLVIMDTPDPDSVDPTGGIRRDLDTYYHVDRVVDGVTILRADAA